MRHLFKTTRVLYDAHRYRYVVQYRKWFKWINADEYPFDHVPGHNLYYRNKEKARDMAIERAQSMLDTVEVWRKSNIQYYI